jgi:hypothetical protein
LALLSLVYLAALGANVALHIRRNRLDSQAETVGAIMSNNINPESKWWAKGLLFENCNCQIVCPGHVSFKQLCTHVRCLGHWSFHIEEGKFGDVSLDDLNVVILYDCPQQMFEGGWTELIYIDERADEAQRRAIERILTGEAGGPWAVLSRFVSKRLDTRFLPIRFDDQGRKKKMWVEGIFDTTVENVRGQERNRDVVIENMYNLIHSSPQVIAAGETWCEDSKFAVSIKGTHALYSHFSWSGQ